MSRTFEITVTKKEIVEIDVEQAIEIALQLFEHLYGYDETAVINDKGELVVEINDHPSSIHYKFDVRKATGEDYYMLEAYHRLRQINGKE